MAVDKTDRLGYIILSKDDKIILQWETYLNTLSQDLGTWLKMLMVCKSGISMLGNAETHTYICVIIRMETTAFAQIHVQATSGIH
jgi:hypothetical protein